MPKKFFIKFDIHLQEKTLVKVGIDGNFSSLIEGIYKILQWTSYLEVMHWK